MNLLQMNEVLGDEQQRLRLPSNDLTLQDTAGIDRQLEEGPAFQSPLCTRAGVRSLERERGVSNFVREFVKTCDVCQKERVEAAPRDDREIFPTPPTAPWFRTHVDLCGLFEESGPQKFRYIAVAVDSVTKFVEVRPLRGSK
jgi:hypothetical protein